MKTISDMKSITSAELTVLRRHPSGAWRLPGGTPPGHNVRLCGCGACRREMIRRDPAKALIEMGVVRS